MKRCPKCGAEYPAEAKFCTADAAPLAEVDRGERARVVGGRFELGERIGGGHTGPVYAARDRDGDGAYAVKLIAEDVLPTELTRQRAERELAQLTRLEDPAAARVEAYGREQDSLFVASAMIEGRPLGEVVRDDGPLSEERAIAVATSVSRALMTAAKLGVIHRDLAAKNVLITPAGEPVLINFAVPLPGAVHPGDPAFASPEQIEGRPLDQRSNVYALGALIYFAVTSKPPYRGNDAEMREGHLAPEPPPPPPGASEGLAGVVTKALSQNPSRRFLTLRQLGDALAALAPSGEQDAPGAGSTMKMGQIADDEGAAGKRSKKKKRRTKPKGAQPGSSKTLVGVPVLANQAADSRGAPSGEPSPHPADDQPGAEPDAEPPGADTSAGERTADEVAGGEIAQGEIGSGGAAAAPPESTAPSSQAERGSPAEAGGSAAAGSAAAEPAGPDAAGSGGQDGAGDRSEPAAEAPDDAAWAAGERDSPGASSPAGGKRKRRSQAARSERASRRAFRETLWFKRGELEDSAEEGEAGAQATAEPLDDARYADDGSLSQGDQQRYSLRTGGSHSMASFEADDRDVSEAELMAELKSNQGRLVAGVAAAIAVFVVVFIAAFFL